VKGKFHFLRNYQNCCLKERSPPQRQNGNNLENKGNSFPLFTGITMKKLSEKFNEIDFLWRWQEMAHFLPLMESLW
jgi:hypothetical protein